MALAGWNSQQKLKLTLDSSKIEGDLTDFPVNITLSSGTGITGFDTTDVFDKLTEPVASGTSFLFQTEMDSSDSQHAITTNGNPRLDVLTTPTPSGMLGSLHAPAGSHYISMADSSDWDLTSTFTIDFWFKTTNTSQCQFVITGNANNANEFQIEMNRTAGRLSVYSVSQKCITTNSWNDGDWHHCALVCDGVDMKMYIDGTKDGQELAYAPSWTPSGMYMGSYATSLLGYISEFRISKGIAMWTSNFTPEASPYVADSYTKLLLHFEGDTSNSSHALGVGEGTPEFSSTTASGMVGSASFDGTDERFQVPTHVDFELNTGEWTIDFWVYKNSVNSTDAMFTGHGGGFGGWNATNGHQWTSFIYTSKLYFQYWNGATNSDAISDSDIDIAYGWHHIALVNDSTNFTMYIDGVSVKQISSITPTLTSAPTYLTIGDSVASDTTINGYIAEYRLSRGVARWTSDFSSSLSTEPYTSDEYTKLLLHFEGDASDSEHTITHNGNPAYYPIEFFPPTDHSMHFDGAGDYLSLLTDSDWDFGSGDFTIDFWAKFNVLSVQHTLINVWEDYNATDNWYLYLSADNYIEMFPYGYQSGAGPHIIGTTTITTDTWYHLAWVFDGTDYKCYLNGNEEMSWTGTPGSNANHPLIIGINADSLSSQPLNGYMSELRISKGIARWTSNFTPPTEPYTPDEYTKLLLHMEGDKSDSRHAIECSGGISFQSSVGPFTGKQSCYFHGVADYLKVADHTSLNFEAEDWTVQAWIKDLDNPGYAAYWLWGDTQDTVTTGSFFIFYNGTTWYVRDGAPNNTKISYAWTTNTDWHHWAFVRHGSNLYMYLDGVRVANNSNAWTVANVANDFVLGASEDIDNFFKGYVSDFHIVKGTALYTEPFEEIKGYLNSWYNRKQIIVTAANDNKLYTEIARWDDFNETASLWTRVPTIASGTNTELILYYDTS